MATSTPPLSTLSVLTYELPDGDSTIERCIQRDGSVRWAVRHGWRCLNTVGKWEREPWPSDRTDQFLERCRFLTPEDAHATWMHSESTQRENHEHF